jgi:hypothetical protein
LVGRNKLLHPVSHIHLKSIIKSSQNSNSPTLFRVRILIAGHPATALIDSGASCCFLNSEFVSKHELKTYKVKPREVKLATEVTTQVDQRIDNIPIRINSYHDKQKFMILPLLGHDVILGMTWLRRCNPKIDWQKNHICLWHGKRFHRLKVLKSKKELVDTNSCIQMDNSKEFNKEPKEKEERIEPEPERIDC